MAPSVNPSTADKRRQDPNLEIAIVEHGFEGPPGSRGLPGQGTSGLVAITDVTPLDGKYVGEKFYKSGTVPANVILNSITTNSLKVKVQVIVIGGFDTYTPSATVNGVIVTNLVESSTKRYYYGEADVDLNPEDLEITAALANGVSTSISIIRKSDLGPVISEIYFGTYPGNQTELKEGDQVEIHCICSPDTDLVEILESAAIEGARLEVSEINSGGVGLRRASGFVTVKSAAGLYEVQARGINASSIPGDLQTSQSELRLNQTHPTIELFKIEYPGQWSAANQYDKVNIVVDASNYDVIVYASTALHIDSPRIYRREKEATVIGEFSSTVSLTLVRTANNAILQTSIPIVVASQDLSAVVTVVTDTPGILLKSSEGTTYKVRLKPNQPLGQPPSVTFNVDSSVTWTYNSTTEEYEGSIDLYESNQFTTVELADATIVSTTNLSSSDVRLDRVYSIVAERTDKLYISAGSTESVIVPFTIDSDYEVLLFGSYPMKLRQSLEYQSLGYCIVDDDDAPAESGTKIVITDPALLKANTTGLLTITIRHLGDSQ